ncbi:MAG: flagellar basal body protein FliL [Alphaproteobacteria bacterium]|nr:flagellar basal body protein FliL [Alphaproteobacteria bacterium]
MAKDKDDAKVADEDKKKDGEKTEGEAQTEGAPKKKGLLGFLNFSRKTLMFVVAPAGLGVVVLAAGAYFFLFSGEEPQPAEEGGAPAQAAAAIEHPTFVDVPEILVNLATTADKPAYLKLSVSLELKGGDEAAKALEPVLPRVVDQFQTYLRELRVEDLSGSAAMFRLKEELLRRVNTAVEPVEIKDVLFKEMIVQ